MEPPDGAEPSPFGISRPGGAERADRTFALVMGFWAIQACLNLFYMAMFGQSIPFVDDSDLQDVLTGDRPLSAAWLWERLNEHRFPVVRLALWGLARLTDNDLRLAHLANTVLVNLTGLVLLVAIRRGRGRSSPFDLLIVMFAMSWIHWWNLVQGIGMTFVLYAFLLAVTLSLVWLRFWDSDLRTLILLPVLLLLPVNGGIGLITSGPLTVFLAIVGGLLWRRGCSGDRRRALLLGAGAAGTSLLMSAYLTTSSLMLDQVPRAQFDLAPVITFLRTLSMPVGVSVRGMWSLSQLLGACIVIVTYALIAMLALYCFVREPRDRIRTLGLLSVMAGPVLVAVAIGLSRSWVGEQGGLWSHYSTAMAPLALAVYLLAQGCTHRTIRLAASTMLLALGLFALTSSAVLGWKIGWIKRDAAAGMTRDLRAGYAIPHVVVRYKHVYYGIFPKRLERALELLQRHGQGPFNPELREWLLPLPPLEFSELPLQRSKEGTPRIRPIAEGAVEISGADLVLRTGSAATAFELPRLKIGGAGSALIRIELSSPRASTFRLLSQDVEPQAGERIVKETSCRQGRNFLYFHLSPRETATRYWRLAPGMEDTQFRLHGLAFLELPVADFARPREVPISR